MKKKKKKTFNESFVEVLDGGVSRIGCMLTCTNTDMQLEREVQQYNGGL